MHPIIIIQILGNKKALTPRARAFFRERPDNGTHAASCRAGEILGLSRQ